MQEFSPLPLTKVEREQILDSHARPGILGGWNLERYESTVLKLEHELVAVKKERDEYHRVADAWIPDFREGRDDLQDARGAQWDRQGFIS